MIQCCVFYCAGVFYMDVQFEVHMEDGYAKKCAIKVHTQVGDVQRLSHIWSTLALNRHCRLHDR